MKDRLGELLKAWRIRAVLPHVAGELLDVGCGTNDLVRAYGRGVGVDVYAWENVDVVVEDSAQLPFESERFDTVTIVAALNHIPNRREVLAEVHRVLRPGGRLVLTMIPPRISAVWHLLRRPWDADQHDRGMKQGEVYGLTQRRVRELLAETGFRVARQRRFMLGVNCLTTAHKEPLTQPRARRSRAVAGGAGSVKTTPFAQSTTSGRYGTRTCDP